jgi:hypothetical protein
MATVTEPAALSSPMAKTTGLLNRASRSIG